MTPSKNAALRMLRRLSPPEQEVQGGGRPLRRRIAAGILAVTSLTVLLFALPLAVAIHRLYQGEQLARLQRDATRVVALVPDNPISSASRVQLPDSAGTDVLIGIYTPGGTRAGGGGPADSAIAASSQDGRVHQGTEHGQLTVAVPVPSDRRVVAVVRAAVPVSVVRGRSERGWVAMSALGLLVLAVAALLARRQAGRISAPLERLTVAARALGDGDFIIAPERSGIHEADAASAALRDTAARLGELLDRERAFSADASHQLRTPLTGLLLGLESALAEHDADLRAAASNAIDRGRQLQETIDHLLSLRRDTRTRFGSVDVAAELSAASDRWQRMFSTQQRRIAVTVPAVLPPARTSPAALRQILDVLVDNALQHGAGAVTLAAADLGDAVALEVIDDGEGLHGDAEAAFTRRSPAAGGHGIGLALARSLAEAEGGRLLIRHPGPKPVFALILPAAEVVAATVADPTRRSGC